MAKKTLFDESKIGNVTLRNRAMMAPLTRQCADDDGRQMKRWSLIILVEPGV